MYILNFEMLIDNWQPIRKHPTFRARQVTRKKLSWLSKYSVAISFYRFLQNIRKTQEKPKFKFKFSKKSFSLVTLYLAQQTKLFWVVHVDD